MTYFFSADHHLDHKNVIKFCNRPFSSLGEMNETIIDRHNSVVSKNDTTVIAGDFSFASKERTFKDFISRLNGKLIFLKGSHDYWMGKHGDGYHEIWQKGIEGQMVVACHYNLRVWPASHYNSWLVYGHSHGKLAPNGKQWDVGVDCNNFYPVSFDVLKVIMGNSPDNFNLVKKMNPPTIFDALSEEQANAYVKIKEEFDAELRKLSTHASFKYLRLGQMFYNWSYGKIYHDPKPELFYEKDKGKASRMIDLDIVEYITKKA